MFYIHGGGYMEGSGDDFLYGPDFLINENVILVTMDDRSFEYEINIHRCSILGDI